MGAVELDGTSKISRQADLPLKLKEVMRYY